MGGASDAMTCVPAYPVCALFVTLAAWKFFKANAT